MAEKTKSKVKGKDNRTVSKKWKKYTISGDKVIRAKTCPRCGPGIFLAVHKGRLYCGKCAYTEFTKD